MNIANKLTVLRVLMIPFFLFALWSPIFGEYGRIAAAFVFIAASITDFIDGWIARKYDIITNFGKFMDPLADKLLVSAALIALTQTGEIAAWVVIILIGREFIVTGVKMIAAEQGIVIAADTAAKFKTAAQMTAVIFFILGLQQINQIFETAGSILLGITIVLSIVSAYGYISKNISIFRGDI